MSARLSAALAAGWLLAAAPAWSGEAARLDGAVRTPIVLDEATLATFPSREIDIAFESGHGRESGHYAGVPLWSLVERAGLVNAEGKNTALRHTLLVTGRDGYAVALALGEIDPDYEGKAVVLAFTGGEPAASFDALRLLVPGDVHGGRSIRDVVRIEVK
jgi:hypothetical protein